MILTKNQTSSLTKWLGMRVWIVGFTEDEKYHYLVSQLIWCSETKWAAAWEGLPDALIKPTTQAHISLRIYTVW